MEREKGCVCVCVCRVMVVTERETDRKREGVRDIYRGEERQSREGLYFLYFWNETPTTKESVSDALHIYSYLFELLYNGQDSYYLGKTGPHFYVGAQEMQRPVLHAERGTRGKKEKKRLRSF